jgi:hypothetical protein
MNKALLLVVALVVQVLWIVSVLPHFLPTGIRFTLGI